MRALFVSKEHTRLARLRTHKAYHGIVYIIVGVIVLQIPFLLYMRRQSLFAALLHKQEKAARTEQARLAEAAVPLRKMEEKIEEARRWSTTQSERIAVSEILSRLEQTVTEGICFSEVTINNGALGPRDPDCFEIEVCGFSRTRGQEAWQREVERAFPAWDVSAHRVGGVDADIQTGDVFPIGLLIKQPDWRTKRKVLK